MAASVTKHAYDAVAPPLTHRNVENFNGKMMHATTSNATDTFDWSKNEAIKQQRKLRLTQVRGQSKEIASQVRKKVEDEKQRQLDVVNKIKQNELLKWRQQQIAQTEGDYKTCLYEVGAAHLAAERETEKMKQIDAQRAKNRKLAVQRSKLAAEKVKAKKSTNRPTARVKETQVHTVATQVDHSLSADSDSDAASSSMSSASSVCSVIVRKDKKKISPKKFNSPKSAVRPPGQTNGYAPENFMSVNSSTSTDISLGIESPPVPKFTRVSDLLKRKSGDAVRAPSAPAARTESVVTRPYVSKTFKLDKSGVEPRRSPPKKTTIKSMPTKPGKSGPTHPASLTVQPIKKKSPMTKRAPHTKYEIKPYVPQFIKSKKSIAAATQSAAETVKAPQKVQFYDHPNRFSKEYPNKLNLIENYDATAPLNAMQEAELEREREKNYLLEMAKARKMESVREEQAREKTKIRKDYDLMTTQLADLLKDEELTKRILHSNEVLSEKRLLEIEKERQQLMNADFERILNKPPAVITCPKRTTRAPENGFVDGLNVADRPTATHRATNAADSSDYSAESCNSFLLEYVTSRTTNLANDIGKVRTDKSGDGLSNRKKIDALTSLLAKVNGMRKILSAEIDRNVTNDKTNVDFIMREMDRVNERQVEIMLGDGTAKNDENKENVNGEQLIAERERILKMKESQLEQKVRELYMREKRLKSQKQLVTVNAKQPAATVTAKGGSGADDSSLLDNIPVRIVINVNKDEAQVATNVPKGKKWGEIIGTGNVDAAATETKTHTKTPVVNREGRVYRKTPAKQKPVVDLSSPSTTLTAYLSPPEAVQTELTKTLLRKEMKTAQTTQATNTVPLTNAQDLNPQLLHYIVRLLGMTRTSIEQLNVSSMSTVSTPNSSVVNMSQNRKMSFSSISTTSWPDAMPTIDDAKWEQLNRFIAENYKFVSNLNESMGKAAPEERRGNDVEPAWKELLANEMAAPKTSSDQPKSIMRKRSTKAIETKADEPTKNDLITKYDELTANCTKRINDLDQMLSKVREEKQKLLENTLSSAGSLVTGNTKENITEYMDFPQDPQRAPKGDADNGEATITLQTSNKSADSSAGSDQKSTTAAPSPEFSSSSGAAIAAIINKTGLLSTRTRQFGESKDSGVGVSRPVTSSDFRDSPELRSKPNEQMDKFVPLLNDIPKPKISYRISDIIQSELQLEQGKRADSKERTTKLPPAALTRYSPNEEQAHELSTITEVDTPATSRLNATADLNAADHTTIDATLELQMQNRAAFKQMLYNHFPDFQEYARSTSNAAHGMDSMSVNMTPTASSNLGEKLEKLLEISDQHAKEMKYKIFEAACEASSTSGGNQTSLSYKQFPTHTEYAKDTPGLLDSQSINQCQSSSDHNDTQKEQTTDDSSLPDIVNELRKRNILRDGFGMDSYDGHKSGAENASASGNVGDSLSDTLERELHGLGISWASSMLKKSKRVSTVSSSSTTSSASANDSHTARRPHPKTKKNPSPQKPQLTSDNVAAAGASEDAKDDKALSTVSQLDGDTSTKPINLKEFLARELMKHSSSSSTSSISCNDSSIASIFLKSCLGNSSSNHSSTQLQMPRAIDKQRTSTPVAGESSSGHRSMNSYKKSSSPQPPQLDYRTFPPAIEESDANASNDLTGKLFSGESHLSSVRINHSDGSTSDTAVPSNTNTILQTEQRKHDEFDALITPANVKLNSAGLGSSSTTSTTTTSSST